MELRQFIFHARLLSVGLLITANAVMAQTNPFPNMRWMLVSSPLFPKTYEECSGMTRELDGYISELNASHGSCLQGAPADDHASGGTCSKVACQALHTARDSAQKRRSAEGQVCSDRLREFQAKQRLEAQEERRRKDQAEQQERDAARDRAQRAANDARDDAKRRADRDKRDLDDKAAVAARKRDDEAAVAARRRDDERRDSTGREEETRAARERDDARRTEQAAAAAEQHARNRELAALRAEEEVRQKAMQMARDKRDGVTYEKLLREFKGIKDTTSDAITFAKNPFEKTADVISDRIGTALVNGVVEAAMPNSPEAHDPRYERVVDVVEEVRAKALAGNPFADKVSGTAMKGVTAIQRRVIGEMDRTSEAIASFGSDSTGSSTRQSSDFRPQASLRVPSAEVASRSDNPFDDPPRASAASTRYYDAGSGSTLDIPQGHVMYRDSGSASLRVVMASGVSDPVGDKPELGERGCSRNGVGVVTVVCERVRQKRANPFSN